MPDSQSYVWLTQLTRAERAIMERFLARQPEVEMPRRTQAKQMVHIRETVLLLDDGRKRNTYEIFVNLGKGRKRAIMVRARLESELREILRAMDV